MRDLAPMFQALRCSLRRHLRGTPIRSKADIHALIVTGAEVLIRRLPGLPESDAAILLAAAVLSVLRKGAEL
jgi:hypothetical protein